MQIISLILIFCISFHPFKISANIDAPKLLKRHLKALNNLFDIIDDNSNGFLERSELISYTKVSDNVGASEDGEKQFNRADKDKNGFMSREELLFHYLENSSNNKTLFIEEIENSDYTFKDKEFYIKQALNRFRSCDKDENGSLNFEEFLAFLHPEMFSDLNNLLIKETMESYDLNSNGFIEFEEYNQLQNYFNNISQRTDENMDSNGIPKNIGEIEQRINFSMIDKNSDNKLDIIEIEMWRIPTKLKNIEEEVDRVITGIDTNGDNKISFEELSENDGELLESRITRYGNAYKDEL